MKTCFIAHVGLSQVSIFGTPLSQLNPFGLVEHMAGIVEVICPLDGAKQHRNFAAPAHSAKVVQHMTPQ